MKIAFLVPSLRLSGGLNVVVEHGVRLARDHAFDVSLIITHHLDEERWPYPGLEHLRIVTIDEVGAEQFDLAIATWWDTVIHLCSVPSKRSAYFVQSLEDRFFPPDDPQSALAGLTYRLGLPVVTEARWIAEVFHGLDPALPCFYVRNGVNKDVFPVAEDIDERPDEPLRILVEGNPDDPIKAVPDAMAAIRAMTRPATVTVVAAKVRPLPGAEVRGPFSQEELSDLMARTDVVLKLSRVEGMSGPPLEGFHRGATAVLTPVTGHDEYVHHGWNALLTGWDDPRGTARQLDLLATDRVLLSYLRHNAVATASAWPGWDGAASEMAAALRAIAEGPGPDIATLAPLLREARFRIARDAQRTHEVKKDLLLHQTENRRLQGEWESAVGHSRVLEQRLDSSGERLRSTEQLLGATTSRLAEVERGLAELERSRWLRLLDAVERPVRRRRPGLGSVRQRLTGLRDDARGSDSPAPRSP